MLIYAYQSRTLTKDVTILVCDGEAIQVTGSNKLRAVIGRVGDLDADLSGALLVVESGTPTANGSSFVLDGGGIAINRLRLDYRDLETLKPGTYTLFIDYFDNADNGVWKNVDRHVFCLEDT
jgi:hypothetical protein